MTRCGDRKIFPQIASRGHQGSEAGHGGPFDGPDLSPTLWAQLTEMDADLRAELLQHITCELFQTPKLRCDNRARAQVCATAGAVTLACRTNRRRIGMPVERVEIAAPRCASHARSSFSSTPCALRELHSVTRLTDRVRSRQAKAQDFDISTASSRPKSQESVHPHPLTTHIHP